MLILYVVYYSFVLVFLFKGLIFMHLLVRAENL